MFYSIILLYNIIYIFDEEHKHNIILSETSDRKLP